MTSDDLFLRDEGLLPARYLRDTAALAVLRRSARLGVVTNPAL
jgi:hypothetical protein